MGERPFWETMSESEMVAHSLRVSLAVTRKMNAWWLEQYRVKPLWFWEVR